jgi:cell wall-associated NlpC family hydrolase
VKKVSRLVLTAAVLLAGVSLTTPAFASSTDDEITAVNQKIAATQNSINDAQKNISKLESQQTKDEQEIQTLSANISARQSNLAKQARSAQENNAGSIIEFVTNSKNFSDAIDRVATVVTMVRANNETLAEQKNDKQKVVADKASVAAAAAKQNSLNKKLNQQLTDLAVQKIELKVKKSKEDSAAKAAAQKALATAKKAAKTVKKTNSETTAVKAIATANQAVSQAQADTTTATAKADTKVATTTTATPVATSTTNSSTAVTKLNSTSSTSVATSSVVAAALSLTKMNIPYVWGGSSLAGMDCSGLTMFVYSKFGVGLPHSAAGQAAMTTRESVAAAQPGDLLFWQNSSGVYHVAIYIGGGAYVHAPQKGKDVSVGYVSSFTPSFAGRL